MVALEVRSLAKRFGRARVLSDVTFEVRRGTVHGLLGPNGAGKTTTIGCALGLIRPDAGGARVLGLAADAIHETRGRVGVAFDRPALLTGHTARENLAYAQRLLGTRGGRGIDDVLRRVGLERFANARAGALSAGESKRLTLARALLGQPELLVLDEPLAGLDPLAVRETLELFRELAQDGVTLLLSSHRLEEMERIVDHATILAAGRVLTDGSLDELIGSSEEYLVRAHPHARAAEILEQIGALSESPRAWATADHDALGFTGDAARINRALTEGGCDVSELRPRAVGLRAHFESLLDDAGEPA